VQGTSILTVPQLSIKRVRCGPCLIGEYLDEGAQPVAPLAALARYSRQLPARAALGGRKPADGRRAA
jgi:hypothetical protein